MEKNIRKVIAIVGPTASGKTGVAIELARKFNGEIVSADSRQVYRGLDIGTAKDLKEYGDIKYHLIDIKNPGEKFTLFDYLPLARAAIEDIFSRGKLPIIVGGTGLYVQGLIEGFALSRIKNYELRINHDRKQLSNLSPQELQDILEELDLKAYENLADKQNPHRLIRAIEKAQSGEVVTKKKPNFKVLQLALDWPREELYERIDRRVDERFEEGMLEEVEGLLKSGVNPEWLLGLGLEYRIIGNYVLAHLSEFEEMKQELKYKSHQYAKRQLTWFRRFPEIAWVKNSNDALIKAKKFLEDK